MPNPARFTSGISTDAPWQILAQYGMPNPFDFHSFYDDFDYSPGVTGIYTKTLTGNGTVANAAGQGGTALFTTNSSTPASGDIASIQLPAAGFAMSAGAFGTKKAFFLTRLRVADAANAAFLVGLIQTTTTPFTVTDGIYFSKATGAANNLTIRHAASSTILTTNIPTAAYTLSNNTYLDLGWFLDRTGTVNAFVGSNLIGPSSTVRGPAAIIVPTTLVSANLNLTLALQSGTASSKTMTVDFALAAVER